MLRILAIGKKCFPESPNSPVDEWKEPFNHIPGIETRPPSMWNLIFWVPMDTTCHHRQILSVVSLYKPVSLVREIVSLPHNFSPSLPSRKLPVHHRDQRLPKDTGRYLLSWWSFHPRQCVFAPFLPLCEKIVLSPLISIFPLLHNSHPETTLLFRTRDRTVQQYSHCSLFIGLLRYTKKSMDTPPHMINSMWGFLLYLQNFLSFGSPFSQVFSPPSLSQIYLFFCSYDNYPNWNSVRS